MEKVVGKSADSITKQVPCNRDVRDQDKHSKEFPRVAHNVVKVERCQGEQESFDAQDHGVVYFFHRYSLSFYGVASNLKV